MEMDLSTKLKEKGWHITEGGLTKLQTLAAPGATTVQKLIEIAMNLDMREIGGGALALKRNGKLMGSIVLQISKIRNISAPKSNEESKVAPRTLQIELTDGQQNIFAIELEHNPALNSSMAPGTKVLLKQQRLNLLGAYVKLLRDDMQVLGGQVPALLEKWELARSMHQFSRDTNRPASDAGPPAWVQFGRKLDANALPGQKNFKSLAATPNVKKNENESFNAFRSEAIAEASKQGAKKVFSAGQQIVDSNMKRILDKGYTEEEAKRALMQTNNNLERAFSQLKRMKNNTYDVNNKQQQPRQLANNSKEVSKPTGNVTLSEFLADKLTITQRPTETTEKILDTTLEKQHVTILKNARTSTSATRAEQRKFENNMSSSFAESQQRYKGGGHHHARATENSANSMRHFNNNRSKRNNNEQQQQQESKTSATNENLRQNGAKQMKNRKPLANANNNNNNKNLNNNNNEKHHYNNNNNNNNKLENGEYQNRTQTRHTIEAPKQQQQQNNKSQNITVTQTKINNKNNHNKTDPYDSSKIIGFQSKETNELALNLLKSEGVNLKSTKQATNAMSNPTIKPFKSNKNDYFTTKTATTTTKDNITIQQQSQQQQKFNRNPVAISKEEQLAAGYDNSFNEPWNWRVGDLCMAKYWDDGCYYRAEITAISEKTFVVYFVGYGNHEEVLKADCLPITDEEHRPINNYIDAENDDRNGVQAYLTTASNTNNHRQRYERQVYVPPAKRSEI